MYLLNMSFNMYDRFIDRNNHQGIKDRMFLLMDQQMLEIRIQLNMFDYLYMRIKVCSFVDIHCYHYMRNTAMGSKSNTISWSIKPIELNNLVHMNVKYSLHNMVLDKTAHMYNLYYPLLMQNSLLYIESCISWLHYQHNMD